MIKITRCGKILIPKEEGFIGYAGDNLKVTKEIFVEGITDISLIYRMYLMFDDGTCNFFLLDSQVKEGGTLLVWNIKSDQIFKSGIVQVQVKASNDSGEVFHSEVTTMLVQTSIEFTNYFKNKENSEFLQHEQYLNQLLKTHDEALESVKNSVELANESIEISRQAKQEAVNTLNEANTLLESIGNEEEKIDEKINEFLSMNVDASPVENSTNLITSGGVYSALGTKMQLTNIGTASKLSVFDSLTSNTTIYTFLLSGGIIEGVNENTFANVVNMNGHQVLILTDGRQYKRVKSLEGWSEFTRINVTYDEAKEFVDNYALASALTYTKLQEEQTKESLKDYRLSETIWYFTLKADELNQSEPILCTMYINGNYQVLKMIDGSEYTRKFTQKGTSVLWEDFQQTVFNKEQLASNFYEEGSGVLTPATSMASSCKYKYTKIGNMVIIIIDALTVPPTDDKNYAQYTGLPYNVLNANNLNRTSTGMFISEQAQTYRVLARDNFVRFTQISAGSHSPVIPTGSDSVTVELIYYTA